MANQGMAKASPRSKNSLFRLASILLILLGGANDDNDTALIYLLQAHCHPKSSLLGGKSNL